MLIGAPSPKGAPVLFWPAALVLWGPGSVSSLHAHHAVQLMLALAGTMAVRGRAGGRWQRTAAVLVRADEPHEVDATGGDVLVAFLDAESAAGRALQARAAAAIAPVAADTVAAWRAALGTTAAALDADRVEAWLRQALDDGAALPRMHPRIKRALAHLRAHLAEVDDASLESLAAQVGLSPGRFMHAFTESVGTPLRPYVAWLRVQRASLALAGGASATEAAHAAGFADASHLVRTFKRMLGVTPAAVARRSRDAGAAGS
jgi:AraC-like DNA-binding protein